MTAIKFENIRGRKSAQPGHFNELISITKIGKIAKNEILASTSILSFLGREMIQFSGLDTDLG